MAIDSKKCLIGRKCLLLLFAAGWAGITTPVAHATLVWSDTAPVIDGADIANLGAAAGTTSDAANVNSGGDDGTYIATNRPWLGQTFTTGANGGLGFQLNAITLQHVAYTSDTSFWSVDPGWVGFGNFLLSIGTHDGSTFTPSLLNAQVVDMATSGNPPLDAAGGQSGNGTGWYFTIALDTPLTLADNTTYGFAVDTTAPYIEVSGNLTGTFSGGDAFGVDQGNGVSVTEYSGADHVFHLDIASVAAIPEASQFAMFGLLTCAAVIGRFVFARRRAGGTIGE